MPSRSKRNCSYPGCSTLVDFGFCDKHRFCSYYPILKRPPRARVNLVVGAPGSGKSTFVESQKRACDVVIDLDEIISELTGKPLHSSCDHSLVEKAIQVRNQRIEDCAESILSGRSIWIILTAGITKDRSTWKMMLNPYRTYVMRCSKDECIRRVKERHSDSEDGVIQAIEKWFSNFEPMTTDTFIDCETSK